MNYELIRNTSSCLLLASVRVRAVGRRIEADRAARPCPSPVVGRPLGSH